MIDTHTHIYLEEFDEDRVEVVRRAREAGVERVILPNVDFDTVQAMHATNDLFPGYCRMAMGLHPTSVEADYRERLGQVRELLFSGEYCAVGEIGLDLYWDKTYAEEQKEAFVMQTGWVVPNRLPEWVSRQRAPTCCPQSVTTRPGENIVKGFPRPYRGTTAVM